MSVAVVVASGGFRFRGLRFCKAVQVGRRMLSYCEARSWQFRHGVVPWVGVCPVMEGRYLVLELVNIICSPH